MKLILTRQYDGRYMLSAAFPIISNVHGAGHSDAYLRVGDPVGVKHLCPEGIKLLFNVELKPMESVSVELSGQVITREG